MMNPSLCSHWWQGKFGFSKAGVGCRALNTGITGTQEKPPLQVPENPETKMLPLESKPTLDAEFGELSVPPSMKEEKSNDGVLGLMAATNKLAVLGLA
jgi:hypothetical protein